MVLSGVTGPITLCYSSENRSTVLLLGPVRGDRFNYIVKLHRKQIQLQGPASPETENMQETDSTTTGDEPREAGSTTGGDVTQETGSIVLPCSRCNTGNRFYSITVQ